MTIFTLPDEIFAHIIEMLPARDLLSVMLVSHKFNSLTCKLRELCVTGTDIVTMEEPPFMNIFADEDEREQQQHDVEVVTRCFTGLINRTCDASKIVVRHIDWPPECDKWNTFFHTPFKHLEKLELVNCIKAFEFDFEKFPALQDVKLRGEFSSVTLANKLQNPQQCRIRSFEITSLSSTAHISNDLIEAIAPTVETLVLQSCAFKSPVFELRKADCLTTLKLSIVKTHPSAQLRVTAAKALETVELQIYRQHIPVHIETLAARPLNISVTSTNGCVGNPQIELQLPNCRVLNLGYVFSTGLKLDAPLVEEITGRPLHLERPSMQQLLDVCTSLQKLTLIDSAACLCWRSGPLRSDSLRTFEWRFTELPKAPFREFTGSLHFPYLTTLRLHRVSITTEQLNKFFCYPTNKHNFIQQLSLVDCTTVNQRTVLAFEYLEHLQITGSPLNKSDVVLICPRLQSFEFASIATDQLPAKDQTVVTQGASVTPAAEEEEDDDDDFGGLFD